MQTHITLYGAPPTSIQEVWICLRSALVRTCTSVKWAIKFYSVSCPQRKIRRKTDNIWWNTELTCLRREAHRAQRKAIKSKLGNDREAFKQTQLIF